MTKVQNRPVVQHAAHARRGLAKRSRQRAREARHGAARDPIAYPFRETVADHGDGVVRPALRAQLRRWALKQHTIHAQPNESAHDAQVVEVAEANVNGS